MLDDLGANDELLDLAKQLEAVALSDDYFVSRKLYPNVDFYTGLIYKAMGFPTGMFTVLFALGRLPGWIAQWREMINDPATKIGRPRQVYTGYTARDLQSRRRPLIGVPLPLVQADHAGQRPARGGRATAAGHQPDRTGSGSVIKAAKTATTSPDASPAPRRVQQRTRKPASATGSVHQ